MPANQQLSSCPEDGTKRSLSGRGFLGTSSLRHCYYPTLLEQKDCLRGNVEGIYPYETRERSGSREGKGCHCFIWVETLGDQPHAIPGVMASAQHSRMPIRGGTAAFGVIDGFCWVLV